MTFNQALEVVQTLSKDERLRLAELIWQADGDHADRGLTEAQATELDRRMAHLEAHPEDVVPWEEVEAATRARIRR